MNSRPLYTILISFCITIALIIGLYYYGQDSDKNTSASHFKNTVIQILPRPLILDSNNSTLKNNTLENLITSKSDRVISITNADIDFSNIITILPFNLSQISMYFRYNKEEDRVDFDGHSNRRYQSLEISGYYKHTPYNQIHYVINIHNDSNELNINALYTPPTKENNIDSVTGQFILKTNSSTFFNNPTQKEDLSIAGNFYKTDNVLKLDKVTLTSNLVNLSAEIEINNNNNTISNLTIFDTNLNKIEKNIHITSLYNTLFEDFLNISKTHSNIAIKLQNVTYNNLKIEDGTIQITTGDDKLTIDNLTLITGEKIKIFSKGNITNSNYALEYNGLLNITNISTAALKNLINLDEKLTTSTRDIYITSKIKLSPPLIQLSDLKVTQGSGEANLGLKQYNYNNKTITQIVSEIKNFKQTPQSPSFIETIIKNYNQLPHVDPHTEKKENFTHAKLKFNTIINPDNVKIDDVSLLYISTPDMLELSNIETKSSNLNVNGNISFNFDDNKNSAIIFSGKQSDPYVLYSLLKYNILNCNQLEDCKDFLQNMVKFKGPIKINVQGAANNITPISSVNCSTNLNSTININSCKATIFGGLLTLNGNIDIEDQIKYTFNYEILKANAQSFIKTLFTDKIKIEGSLDKVKGFVSSFGLKQELFLKNINGNADITASNLKIEKLDLKKFIYKYNDSPAIQAHKTKHHNPQPKLFEIYNLDSKFTLSNNEIKSSYFFFNTKDDIKVALSQLGYNISSDKISFLINMRYSLGTGQTYNTNILAKGNLKDININTTYNGE